MTKTDMAFVILGTGCLLLAGSVEYRAHQDKKNQALAEQNGISSPRWKKLEDVFARRADRLLDNYSHLEDAHWGITGGRIARQGKTFFIELNVQEAPAYRGAGGLLVKHLLPYTHPNTLGLFFSEKGLCRTPTYRFLNSNVNIRYNFEHHQETQHYTRSLNSLCGWTKETLPEKDDQVKNKQLADFTFLHTDLRKGFYLTDGNRQGYQTYVYSTLDKEVPSLHFTVTSLSDMPGMLNASYLWRHISSHALCEQLQQFDKLPLTLYANANAVSGLSGSLATQTIDQMCPR